MRRSIPNPGPRARALARSHGLYLLVTGALWFKLQLAHGTLGQDLGQISPWHFLVGALRGLRHGHITSLYAGLYLVSLGTALICTSWTLALRPRARRVCLLVLDFGLSLLILADAVYYRYFHDFLSVSVLAQWREAVGVHAAVATLLRPTDLLLFVDLVLLGIGFAAVRLVPRLRAGFFSSGPTWGWKRRLGGAVGALLLGGVAMFGPVHRGLTAEPNLATNTWARSVLYNIVGLVGVHVLGIYVQVSKELSRAPLSKERLAEIDHWFDHHRAHLADRSPSWNLAPGRNVIVIQVEAFQDFVVNRKVGGVEITPNLNALLPHLLYFPNYFHEAGLGRTTDAELLSLCSLYPLAEGSSYTHVPGDHFDCLPREFRALGYRTVAFHGNDPAFWNRYRVYPRLGFEHFFGLKDFRMPRRIGWGVNDEDFFSQTVDRLSKLPPPFFAFLITITSHYPFHIAKPFRVLPVAAVHTKLLARYLQTVHFFDSALGQLVEKLKRTGLWDSSIVVFYGDHDDSVGDPAAYAPVFGHPLTPYEAATQVHRVGLFIHLPGDRLAGVYPRPAGESDLAPTLFHLLGHPVDHQTWMGDDVLAPAHQVIPFWDGSFASDTRFFQTAGSDQLKSGKCFDQKTKAKLPVDRCRPGFEDARNRREISEDLLTHDLFPKLVRAPEKVNEPKAARMPSGRDGGIGTTSHANFEAGANPGLERR